MRAPRLHWCAAVSASLRWVLGGVFIYAGLAKLQDPASLAVSIARFRIVPEIVINPMALALPPLEVMCGMALLAGPWKRQAALGISSLSALFLVALTTAAASGIAVECSCFGATAAEPLWKLIVRDLLLLVAALAVYIHLFRQKIPPAVEPDAKAAVLNKPFSCLH